MKSANRKSNKANGKTSHVTSVSLPAKLAAAVDKKVSSLPEPNFSAYVRDLIRKDLEAFNA